MACENSQWAKVLWVDDNGVKGSFYTKHPPVSYACAYDNWELAYKEPEFETYTGYAAISNVVINYPLRVCLGNQYPVFGTLPVKDKTIFWVSNGLYNATFCVDGVPRPARRICNVLVSGSGNHGGSNCLAGLGGWSISGNYEPYDLNKHSSGYKLSITDSRGLVFTKTFDNGCPSITVECSGDKCPSNTCEVDCRGHKCCYNSQGRVVKVIS